MTKAEAIRILGMMEESFSHTKQGEALTIAIEVLSKEYPLVIRAKTRYSIEDYEKWAGQIRRIGDGLYCIPWDAEVFCQHCGECMRGEDDAG